MTKKRFSFQKSLVIFFSEVIFDRESVKTVCHVRCGLLFLLLKGDTTSKDKKLTASVLSVPKSYNKYPSKFCHKFFDSVLSSETFK